MRVVERVAGHYEAQDVEFGKVYAWRPETVVTECECGKRATFDRSEIIDGSVVACECGEDRMARIREDLDTELQDNKDETIHPWRYWRTSKNAGLPF